MKTSLAVLNFVSFLVFASATDISEQVFGNIDDAVIAAYGDFNSDELTDVFVLRDNFRTIDIMLGSDDVDHLLHHVMKLHCHYPKLEITSVVPGDFDGDAFMDVMFTSRIDENKVGVYINYGGSDHLNCTQNDTAPIIEMRGEPLAIDFNNDYVIDLFGIDLNGSRTFWIFETGRNPPKTELMMGDSDKELRIPHSHAFLDINDDFQADLLLTTKDDRIEVWLGTDDIHQRFKFNESFPYNPEGSNNKHYGQSIYMDLELNGNIDHLVPACADSECHESMIYVKSGQHYNQLPIDFFQDDNKTHWGFLTPGKEFYRKAITLRTGDFNNDGFPDLLVTLKKKGSETTIQTFLMENVKNVNAKPTDRYKRTFAVRWNALSPFGENTVMGSFYDFYQDGILDVVMLKKNGDKFKPQAFRNTLDYDANFIKVIVLTGLTNPKPPAKETPFGSKKRNYGKRNEN
jgi:integrin alpha FG-GAP repeat containing protein 1